MSRAKRRASSSPAEAAWQRLGERGLPADAVRMAREMGLNPQKLLGNMASVRSEPWKAPTEEWIRDMYATRTRSAARSAATGRNTEG